MSPTEAVPAIGPLCGDPTCLSASCSSLALDRWQWEQERNAIALIRPWALAEFDATWPAGPTEEQSNG